MSSMAILGVGGAQKTSRWGLWPPWRGPKSADGTALAEGMNCMSGCVCDSGITLSLSFEQNLR